MVAASKTSMSRNLLIAAILISTIVGAATGLSGGFLYQATRSVATQTRDIYLFPYELGFNQTTAQGLKSSYIFLPDHIIVNKGDTVMIHFYGSTDDGHTFTMSGTYNVDVMVPGSTPTLIQNKTITINVNTAGTFQYHCRFHPPQMIGFLVVQG